MVRNNRADQMAALGDQIDAATIFARADFVDYIGSGVVRESEVLHRTIRSYAFFLSRDSCEAGQVAIGKLLCNFTSVDGFVSTTRPY